MKVTLSFEKSKSSDVSIMVDALRASSTITFALDNFEKVIPCLTPEEAFKLKEKLGGIVAGERDGKKIDECDFGNSPTAIKDYTGKHLILTTSNGTRILENMKSTVLIGSIINAREVSKKSIEIANNQIDIVMAGVKGEFAIEDFLAAGEILYWILQELPDCNLSEYAKAAVLASRNYESLKESFFNSRSGKRLIELGYESDVDLCSLKNISNNVAIYKNQELTLLKD